MRALNRGETGRTPPSKFQPLSWPNAPIMKSEPLVTMVYGGGKMTGKPAEVSVQQQLTGCIGLCVSIQSTEAQGMEAQ